MMTINRSPLTVHHALAVFYLPFTELQRETDHGKRMENRKRITEN